jgi:hypothetical protein
VALGAGSAAHADDAPPSGFPSWEDVQAAAANVDAAAAEADRVGGLLVAVQAGAVDASSKAVAAAAAYAQAEQRVRDQEQVVETLDREARERAAELAASRTTVGSLAADAYMGGSTVDPWQALSVLEQPDGLGRLQTLQVLGDQTAHAVAAHRVAANAAASAEQKSQAAKDALADLAREESRQFDAAKAAQKDAEAAVAQTREHEDTLVAQLAVLKGTAASVEQGYHDGQSALAAYRAAQEAKRQAAVEAQRRADAEAQRADALGQPQALQPAASAQQPVQAPGPAGVPSPAAPPAPAPPAPAPVPAVSAGVGVVNDPAGAQAYASGRLGGYGWGPSEFPCLLALWNRESGWLTDATNPSSGAYGIAQALPASKYASAGSDWLTNYRTQVAWGLGYIADRYGSPCGAWAHSNAVGWY